MNKFYVCRCFFTNNYFIPQLNIHVVFHGEEEFRRNYEQRLIKEKSLSDEEFSRIVQQLELECQRRHNLHHEYVARKQKIAKLYTPLKPDVYHLKESYLDPKFLELVTYCKQTNATYEGAIRLIQQEKAQRVYSFPVFTKQFCEDFLEEVLNFEKSDMPKGRPNTMNQYGVLLDELGFDEDFLDPLRKDYLIPVSRVLFADWGGDCLDSHKAFIVSYDVDKDRDLNYHYDNAEVTLNVSLSTTYEEGSLYFGNMRTDSQNVSEWVEYKHKLGYGLLHRGQHRHGAMPIDSGERHNLIIWMRSSKIRNRLCPMCDERPDRVETVGKGDGFTPEIVQVCDVN